MDTETLYCPVIRGADTRPAPWHALETEEARRLLETGAQGLAAGEAASRLARFGPNTVAARQGNGAIKRFATQFRNLLIYILLLAGVITAALGHYLDSSVIFGVVLVNAVIGFLQEGRAERALEAIRNLLSQNALVVRDGKRRVIDAAELVPGDLVLLAAGDKVPADIRLSQCRGLRIQEAVLTGESVPVDKTPAAVAAEAPVVERPGMAFSATLVTAGSGSGYVVATGNATEVGRVEELIAGVERVETPLLRQLSALARTLTVAILAAAAATMLFGFAVYGTPLDQMFLVAVALAVAAIPEGLPAIVTITLAIGVERMARRNAIIRRLPAVETLGSVSTICSDKTGTFTRNEMMVESAVTAYAVYAVTGQGYAPEGGITCCGEAAQPVRDPALALLARGAALCNDAALHLEGETWSVAGDPMEGALLAFAAKAGCHRPGEEVSGRIDEIPFDAERRFMATLHREEGGGMALFIKGAPERLLSMSASQVGAGGEESLDTAYWHTCIDEIAGRGNRVIALACTRPDGEIRLPEDGEITGHLAFVGLLGLIDPPREEAIQAVESCRRAMIHVKMITGDHSATARAIARRLGLEQPDNVLTGSEIDLLGDGELAAQARISDVFARTSPEHKLRLVTALQSGGQCIAMTGDGVNDAPALKRADVGIAMGRKGSDAAKEAAEMVLADDNFASIVAAVEEGRVVYDNLKKALAFILPTNGGEALTLLAAVLVGLPLPITPVQILWVNMITAVTLALALAFEPAEGRVMARPPRDPGQKMLTRFLAWRILFVSALAVAGVFGIFLWLQGEEAALDRARTAAVTVLVLIEVVYLFSIRRSESSAFADLFSRSARPAWIAVALVLAMQAAFIYLPTFNLLFSTVPLSLADLAMALAIAGGVFGLVEAEKYAFRMRR